MSETSESSKPEIIETGFFYDKITGTDSSKPVKKQRVEIIQIGLNPSNIAARIPKSHEPVELGDVQRVHILQSMERTVPDDLARRVGLHEVIRDRKFARKYMQSQPRK